MWPAQVPLPWGWIIHPLVPPGWRGEGLTNPRMTFEDFAATPFYQWELESLKERGAERKRVKEERTKIKTEQHTFGRLCRFCHQPLKQGPTSPHVHATFPGVTGKYIYCPARMLSLYRTQGRTIEMTWREFKQSQYYGAEKQSPSPATLVMDPPSICSTKLESTPPLPPRASLRAARIGPIKTGGLIFVLDHSRWTEPMRAAIDGLLAKHHGRKEILKWVDADYAALIQRSCRDPNSLLHPTTRQHISRYVKHVAKLKNASTSLNTSPEKLLETQQLWQSLTAEEVSVPVTTLPPAVVNPPAVNPSQSATTNQAEIERVVREVLEKKESLTAAEEDEDLSCLACGQPKSRYLGDGSSIHLFHQAGEVSLPDLCRRRPHQSEDDFAATPFYQRELESLKERGAERKRVKEERSKIKTEQHTFGHLCRFCHQPLKQGPTSPHIHTTFPGVTGKYIYCPQKVLSLYRTQGMTETMTWRDFQQSKHYGAEKQRRWRGPVLRVASPSPATLEMDPPSTCSTKLER
ncbi:hypothetical protein N1851_028182 [Merluccius polli]|uniref:Uncharacterized protein n=1 Tax=Merluccius polli TaxID=89951 RepID=A0AA47M946_MERPO|nr:hypothetical protein N1851_028182 [Merluccius polli]